MSKKIRTVLVVIFIIILLLIPACKIDNEENMETPINTPVELRWQSV